MGKFWERVQWLIIVAKCPKWPTVAKVRPGLLLVLEIILREWLRLRACVCERRMFCVKTISKLKFETFSSLTRTTPALRFKFS